MIFGYARVSTQDQNLDRQTDQLKGEGCEKIFEEKVTGTKAERPELGKLLDQLRQGDILVVADLTRLSRSTRDLIDITEKLQTRGIELKSMKENIDTTTATGKAMFGMLAVMAQFERDLISERTKQGLESARARGRQGGRPKKAEDKRNLAFKMYDSKDYSIAEITDATGISKPTLYRYIRERKAQ